MEDISPFVAECIARYLSRKECIFLSWCSRTLHQLMDNLCHLRLTERQAEVAKKIIALKPELWRDYIAGKNQHQDPLFLWLSPKIDFPDDFMIASGPSTGKTAIVLYMLAYYHQRGVPVFVTVPIKLAIQWQNEGQKFSKQFGLPPLCIVHPRYCPNWRALLDQGHLPIVPDSVVRVQRLAVNLSPINSTQEEFVNYKPWQIVFVDEGATVIHFFNKYSLLAAQQNRPFHMVCLNASKGGDKSLSVYAKDSQLGQLPDFEVIVEQSPYSQTDARYKTTLLQPCPDDVAQFLDKYRGKKTLLLCDSSKHVLRPGSPSFDWINYLALEPYATELANRGFVNISNSDTKSRAIAMQNFANCNEGALAAPMDYVLRGWNLKCDAVLLINTKCALTPNTTIQLLGRVLRVESPFQTVRLCIQQNHDITANELACHALVASGTRSTDKFIKDAKWFNTSPRMVTLPSGKRQKLDYELTSDLSIQGRMNLFSVLFPDDSKYVSEINETRLVIKSRPDNEI